MLGIGDKVSLDAPTVTFMCVKLFPESEKAR